MMQHNEVNINITKHRIEVAEQDLKSAKLLMNSNDYRGANNRAYYTIFHSISAVQALDGKSYKKHKDAIANFNRDYIHTGIFDKLYGRQISEAEIIRHESDYDDFFIVNKEDTKKLISLSEQLLSGIKEYLLKQNVQV